MAAVSVGPVALSQRMPGGDKAALNVTAATVIKGTPGVCVSVSVVVAGTAAGAAYDNNATTGNSSANQFGTLPDIVGTYEFDWPCGTGITLVPGTGQTLAVSYS